MTIETGLLRPDEHAAVLAMRARTFTAADPAAVTEDPAYVPDDRRLAAREDGQLIGTLGAWPFRQVVGGREVPMSGIAGVIVEAHARRRGAGSRLLAAGIDLVREHGDPIATLYPATVAPYRAWGWALAGHHLHREVATRALTTIPAPTMDVRVRPGSGDDHVACAAVARAVARTEPGGLVAPDRWYRRRLDLEGTDHLDVAEVDGEVAGFALWSRANVGDGWRVEASLVVGTTVDVERALWRQLGSWWSVGPTTQFVSWPADPLVADLAELDTRIVEDHPWMTRLVDAPAAIAARGWPDGVTVAVPLHVHDDRILANDGKLVLEVADGRARLTSGGEGRVEVDVRDLAALYTGYLPARVLARRGGLPGATDADVAALADAFDAPTPWLREYF